MPTLTPAAVWRKRRREKEALSKSAQQAQPATGRSDFITNSLKIGKQGERFITI
jgi:hypothetical protein